MSAEQSTKIDYENHPVFSVLFRLCGNHLTPKTLKNLSQCPGITAAGKRCKRRIVVLLSDEIDAQIKAFNEGGAFRHGDSVFRDRVEAFFKRTHCKDHWESPQQNITAWIEDKKSTTQKPETDTHPDLNMDAETRNAPLSSDSGNHGITEKLSSLSISPSQESEISFSGMSDADTVITTPDATPLSQIDNILSCEPESRPETPCPEPRTCCNFDNQAEKGDLHVKSHNDNNEEVSPLEDANMMDKKLLRHRTLKIGKIPLLRAIHHGWTARDSKVGKVYIWTHNQHRDIIKIGWSASAGGSARRHGQPSNCYGINTTPFWESPEAFVGAYRVEQIVQRQLHENNAEVECGSSKCVARHREWFRCDTEEAKSQIMLWTQLLAEGFYEGCGGGLEVDDSVGMRISAKGNSVLTKLCAIPTADILQGLLNDAPEASTGSMEEVPSSEETDAPVGVSDQLPLSVDDGCVGQNAANHGREPSRQESVTDLGSLQPRRDGNTQEPPVPVPGREHGPPRQGKRALLKLEKFFRTSFGRHDVESNPAERSSRELNQGDGANGGGDLDSKHDDDTFHRLYISIFSTEIKFELSRGRNRKST